MKAKGILLATVAGVSIVAASQSSAHQRGWYVGLEAGVNWIDDTSVIFSRNGFSDVMLASDSIQSSWWNGSNSSGSLDFDTGWAGFATIGYGFEKNWRIELELGYRDNDASLSRTTCYGGYERLVSEYCRTRNYDGDMTEYTAMINVIYDVPLTEKLDLNLGLGAGVDYVQLDLSRSSGTTFVDDSDTRFAFQAIAGLTYKITKRLDLALTYRYLNVSEPEFSNAYKTLELEDLEKHTVTIGLRYDLYADEEPLPPPPPPPPLPPAPQQFIIYFGFDKCNITPEADGVLNEAAAAAKTQGAVKVVIVGHTDTMGSNDYNQNLSECRAGAAKSNLVGKGIDAGSISTSGRGEGELMVKTGDSVKEPQNRRATIDLNK